MRIYITPINAAIVRNTFFRTKPKILDPTPKNTPKAPNNPNFSNNSNNSNDSNDNNDKKGA